jgi:hypothetical protein
MKQVFFRYLKPILTKTRIRPLNYRAHSFPHAGIEAHSCSGSASLPSGCCLASSADSTVRPRMKPLEHSIVDYGNVRNTTTIANFSNGMHPLLVRVDEES